MLAHQLGHSKQKKYDISINAKKPPAGPAAAAVAAPAAPAAPSPVKKALTKEEEFQKGKKLKQVLSMAENSVNKQFSDMFKAFQYIDLDRSGRLSRAEIERALDLWNIPMDDDSLDQLMGKCDADDDGGISYEEFVDALARDTVATGAMGKRGMQSKEAMGVDSQEMLAHQLGHSKQKKFSISINSK